MELRKLSAEDLITTWTDYKTHGGRARRNGLVEHYTGLVRYVASKAAAGLPTTIDRDDLISYGIFGLLDAIDKFDLDKGVKFETYAVPRIKGAIIDELRSQDWVPRSVRAKARDLDRVRAELETELGHMPSDAEIAARLDITVPELWTLASQAAVTTFAPLDNDSDDDRPSAGELTFDPAANPEDLFASTEVSELMANAIDTMEQRSKQILVLYYLHQMTLAEIGRVLGVTESRVCQLQSKVLRALGDALTHGHALAAA